MQAVIAVLDEDLERHAESLATPLLPAILTGKEWAAAEQARAEVERSVHALERSAVAAAAKADDWRAKARLASKAGRPELADQAQHQAAEADREHDSLLNEISLAREFLHEWTVRVKSDAAG